jgi:hypothetical protein
MERCHPGVWFHARELYVNGSQASSCSIPRLCVVSGHFIELCSTFVEPFLAATRRVHSGGSGRANESVVNRLFFEVIDY